MCQRTIACTFLLSSALLGQPTQTQPALEVASVKRSAGNEGNHFVMNGSRGRITFSNVPLKWVIRSAYGVQDNQVSGPDWLDVERYDINATYPPDSGQPVAKMLQSLLADRFKLVAHSETKELPAYVLTVGKGGAKLHEAEGNPTGYQMRTDGPLREMRTRANLKGLAVYLSGFLHLPVVEQTGIKGVFDIVVNWRLDDSVQSNDDVTELIRESVETQLGLKLELKKVPMETVVVDHAEKSTRRTNDNSGK